MDYVIATSSQTIRGNGTILVDVPDFQCFVVWNTEESWRGSECDASNPFRMPLERPDLGVVGHVPQDNGLSKRAWKQLSTHWDFFQTVYAIRMTLKSSNWVMLVYSELLYQSSTSAAYKMSSVNGLECISAFRKLVLLHLLVSVVILKPADNSATQVSWKKSFVELNQCSNVVVMSCKYLYWLYTIQSVHFRAFQYFLNVPCLDGFVIRAGNKESIS